LGREVVFAGALDDVRPALAAGDIFVLSSVPRSEGVPTAAEEAMAMGLPVVSTNVGGVSELVEDGVTGLLVRPLDPAALALAVVGLTDPQKRARMGASSRKRAVELCSKERCAAVHLQAYQHALAHRTANGRRRRLLGSGATIRL
jgi:glycosyltransferase involved in cell wall biosynthesis